MGKIHGGRFSSPVYVTVAQIDKVLKPIITVLNAAHNKQVSVQYPIQEEFESRVL